MRYLIPLVMILCSACSLKLQQASVQMPSSYIYGDATHRDKHLESQWWHIYDDPVLDSLMFRALNNNRNLQIAASRVIEAHHNIALSRASLLPSFNAGIVAEGQRTPPAPTMGEFMVEGAASWNTALFGAIANTSRKARAKYFASEWSYRALILSLTHQVATSYFTLREAHHALRIARESHRLRVESAKLIDSMARYGFSSGLDREQANSLVDVAAADIAQYERAVAQASLSLCLLLGSTPEHCSLSEDETLPPLPDAVPAGVPSELLSRRPDVMEAYYQMRSAAANVGIARSARLPNISLTASGGLFGDSVHELFTHGGWAWSATGQLMQPIFAFGRLRRTEKIAREEYNQSVLQYEQTVLQALEEVESALAATATVREQAKQYAEYVERNYRIASLTQSLYEMGMSNYLDVISTQQTWYSSQLQLSQLLSQEYTSLADLVLALGDGWEVKEKDERAKRK